MSEEFSGRIGHAPSDCQCVYCIDASKNGPDFVSAVVGMTETDATKFLKRHGKEFQVIRRDGAITRDARNRSVNGGLNLEVNENHIVSAFKQGGFPTWDPPSESVPDISQKELEDSILRHCHASHDRDVMAFWDKAIEVLDTSLKGKPAKPDRSNMDLLKKGGFVFLSVRKPTFWDGVLELSSGATAGTMLYFRLHHAHSWGHEFLVYAKDVPVGLFYVENEPEAYEIGFGDLMAVPVGRKGGVKQAGNPERCMAQTDIESKALEMAQNGDGLFPSEMVGKLRELPGVNETAANNALRHLVETNRIELSGKFKLVAIPSKTTSCDDLWSGARRIVAEARLDKLEANQEKIIAALQRLAGE